MKLIPLTSAIILDDIRIAINQAPFDLNNIKALVNNTISQEKVDAESSKSCLPEENQATCVLGIKKSELNETRAYYLAINYIDIMQIDILEDKENKAKRKAELLKIHLWLTQAIVNIALKDDDISMLHSVAMECVEKLRGLEQMALLNKDKYPKMLDVAKERNLWPVAASTK